MDELLKQILHFVLANRTLLRGAKVLPKIIIYAQLTPSPLAG